MKHQYDVPGDWSEEDCANLEAFLKLPNVRAHIQKVLGDIETSMESARIIFAGLSQSEYADKTIQEALYDFGRQDRQASRLARQLKYSKVHTLGQLSRFTAAEILRMPNLGQKSIRLAYDLLRHYGFDPKWKL